MRRRALVVAGILALIAVAAGVWIWRGRGGTKHAGQSGEAAELAARKRAARGSAPADPTPGAIAGIVKRKKDGAPIPGAVVTVSTRELDLGGGGKGAEPTVVTAGADGRFEVKDQRPGRYAVSAAS